MLVHCLHCKNELKVEVTERSLVPCPSCEFLFALAPGGKPEIPTYSEEAGLARVDARTAVVLNPITKVDTTLIGDTTAPGELPVPYGKVLYVEVLSGPAGSTPQGTVFRFTKGRITFGRTDGDILLDDQKVSRKHAVIEAISRENIYLRDLASTNGTLVNDHRVTTIKLRHGDTLQMGHTVLRFHADDQ